jgi:prolipoprotein diacylglyceryltransferase
MPAPFVAGVFLVLNGLARFVEEAYRGETQTPISQGLRLYQWIALGGVIVGAAVSTLPSEAHTGVWQPWLGAIGVAAVLGLVVGAALGVDFPASNRRFSRLV